MKSSNLSLIASLILFSATLKVHANSEIFPAVGAAQEKINWKDGYFVINGKPTFLTAGEIHYARIPRELWRDRLWRTKQLGFNTIQMYVFWNAHQPKEGVWDFTDNLDLDAWLSLIQEMGMYAIVRVGPYSCAEWEHGGFPAWLTVKPGMVVRDMDEQYNKYADAHLAKVEQIVAKHQIHKGGNVIMVQLENEHSRGWGTEPYPYLMHLYEKARENGLEIPLFFSGLHHGSDPSGEKPYTVGTSPWFSTEFWTGWIGKYGDMDAGMLQQKIRGTWKIIAFGGAGYDYYVVHGGTNFGYSGDSFEATYDYSCPIGEAGQFHNLYPPARRAASFAQSFSDLLTASSDQPDFATSTTPGQRITTRGGPLGTIVFADNFSRENKKQDAAAWIAPEASAYKVAAVPGQSEVTAKVKVKDLGEFPKEGNLVLRPHDIRTLIFNLPWTAATSFESITTNILFRHTVGGKEVWVCYGTPGDTGEITLKRKTPGTDKFSFIYPQGRTVQELALDSGDGQQIQLLIMSTALADLTWWNKDRIIVGASFVREDGSLEFPPEGGTATIFSASGKSDVASEKFEPSALPVLANWQWRDASAERKPDYADANWLQSKGPQAMETYDSFQNRYGWYRTTLHADKAGTTSLRFMGQNGKFYSFLNGEPADLGKLTLKAGDNALSVFAKIGPRPKWYNFLGPTGTEAARGLWGLISTVDKPLVTVNEWKQSPDDTKDEACAKADFNDQAWASVDNKEPVKIGKKTLWFRASFTLSEKPGQAFASFPQLNSTSGLAFLNGQRVLNAGGNLNPADISAFLQAGTNVVAIEAIGKHDNRSTVSPKFEAWTAQAPTAWKFRGGLEGLEETAIVGRVTNWEDFLSKPWSKDGAPQPGLPTLWKTTFEYKSTNWETIGLNTPGLKAGHVWLNGHNLGESPQKVPMYLPECWLKQGTNTLVVFDAEGSKPDQVTLSRYESRKVSTR